MKVEYHPLTTTDLNKAVAHYNRQQAGLGDQLRTAVYAAIERVLAGPSQFSVVSKDIRRCEDALRVLVIRDHSRHPRFGLHRR